MSKTPNKPGVRAAMWGLGLCAAVAFVALLLNLGVSLWCETQPGLSLPRQELQRASTWAFWIWLAAGMPAVLLYAWIRRSILVGLITISFVGAVAAGLIARDISRAHQDVVEVVVVDGVAYGVLQTAAVMAPDTYVELVTVEDRSLLVEHFTRIAPTNIQDFGPVPEAEVTKHGERWNSRYDDDYGFIVLLDNGWVVAGLGDEAVEVGYDTKTQRPVLAEQLEAKFGKR